MDLKILQVASYNGNIGDYANHNGFRNSLAECGIKAEYTDLEIRNFYRIRGGKFDDQFVKLANEHDVIVFGGGCFWDLRWEDSYTGTTLDLSRGCLESIKKPILFNCIGVNIENGYKESVINKFADFLDYTYESPQFLLTVRNDGAHGLLHQLYGEKYSKNIMKVPDGGFFAKCDRLYEHCEIEQGAINIAINLGGDKPDIRFSADDSQYNEDEFVKEFSEICNDIMTENKEYRIIFVPHIYSDLRIIYKVMAKLDDDILRRRVTCASCFNGLATDGMKTFDLYRKCDLVLGMRYHANVVPVGMNIPTIMLGTLGPHIKLYDDICIPYRCVRVNKQGFGEQLKGIIEYGISHRSDIVKENQNINMQLEKQNNIYMNEIKSWLKQNNIV